MTVTVHVTDKLEGMSAEWKARNTRKSRVAVLVKGGEKTVSSIPTRLDIMGTRRGDDGEEKERSK